jgi:uncharacterized protein (DUF2252 family)
MYKVTQRIKQFNKGRLPDKLQLKYEFMSENIFRFYRGTCHLFYEDLYKKGSIVFSPLSWICGDLHIENFGSFKGDNRLVYFDLNDFDEACLAPAAFEVARAVTSIFVAFSSLKIKEQEALTVAKLFLDTYTETLKNGKPYYIEPQTAKGIVHTFLEEVCNRKEKQVLQRFTVLKKNKRALIIDKIHFYKIDKPLKKQLNRHIKTWLAEKQIKYAVKDIVFRIAGTGSVGVRRYVFLLENVKITEKYILLEMKEEDESLLAPYLKVPQPKWKTSAERVVAVQERMQNVSAALLDTIVFDKRSFIIQEMQPVKDSIDFTLIKERPKDIHQVISDMAMLTASAQLRSSGRQGSATADELIAFGQNNKWQESILNYSIEYKKQVEKDYRAFCADYKKGLLKP